jgi:CheY-like chemotaxis protein
VRGKKTILLVDDDIDDLEIFCSALEGIELDAECFTARNGQDALQKLTSGEVKPEIIFLDLNMPLMNGKQFLKEIKQKPVLNNIPVVILSTSSDPESINETKKLGASHFLTKPDKFSVWEKILSDILLDNRPASLEYSL